jgi:hypothetical protein
LAATAGGLTTTALVLPAAGTVASLGRLGRRIATALGSWARGRPPRVAAVTAVGLALAGFTAYILWPNGDYQPIGPEDRGTVTSAVDSLKAVPGGRPSVPEDAPEGQTVPPESQAPEPATPAEGGESTAEPGSRATGTDAPAPRGEERSSDAPASEGPPPDGTSAPREGSAPSEGSTPQGSGGSGAGSPQGGEPAAPSGAPTQP